MAWDCESKARFGVGDQGSPSVPVSVSAVPVTGTPAGQRQNKALTASTVRQSSTQ